MARFLVTGGCGFIGTNLIEYLLERIDERIMVLDNFSEGKKEYLKGIDNYSDERISLIKGDVRKKEDVKAAMENCEYVIHLAAQTDVMDSIKKPKEDADINIMGTINLLNESVDRNVKRFVFASSAAPLGEQKMPIHENKVPRPLAPYGASKLAGEGYCSAYAGSFGLKSVALRFSNVYGPKSWHKGSVVAKFIKQIIEGETPKIFGDGDQTRDFIHTKDISQALYLSCTEKLDKDFELFQIATGEETTINDLYSMLKKKLEDKGLDVPKVNHIEERDGEIYRNYADISKAKRELDYNPEVTLDEGLDDIIDWFLNDYL